VQLDAISGRIHLDMQEIEREREEMQLVMCFDINKGVFAIHHA
jgi:hypothetical protein